MPHSNKISLVVFVIALSAAHADEPPQLKLLDSPQWIFPDQIIRIAVEQASEAGPVHIEAPANVELLDRWSKGTIHRFYFRSVRPGKGSIDLRDASATLQVPFEVLPWSEVFKPRTVDKLALPRIWPLGDSGYDHVKQRHTLHGEAELAALRNPDGKVKGLARRWHEMTDDEIWNIVPGPSVPRTCLIVLSGGSREDGRGKGCPVCGMKIYEGRSGFYPWIFDLQEHPWKVGCPSCDTWFPSNDWHLGDMHSGDFPDDGFGCEPVTPVLSPNGTPWRWPFIAYYHQWEAYMRGFTPGIEQTALAFARTGDPEYAHKAAIGLFRFAESMLDMSLNLSHRKMAYRDAILRWPIGAPSTRNRLAGSFLYIQPNWDTTRMEQCAKSWDLIFDALDDSQRLIDFCQAHHHPEIQSIEDFRRFVEAGVIRVPLQACLDNAVARNFPMQETLLATLAVAVDSPRSVELAEYLLHDGAGLRFTLTNDFFKDGSACESESYNHIHIRDLDRLFDQLDRVRQLHPQPWQRLGLTSPREDPKYRLLYDFPIENSLIGCTTTWTGDTGNPKTTNRHKPMQGFPLSPSEFAAIYRQTQDPRFAQALVGPSGSIPAELKDPQLRKEVRDIVEQRGWQVKTPSSILDGYGHAILRSGDGDSQRAFWLRYGRVKQHAHQDLLTMGLAALGRDMLPEMGYPQGWTHAGRWAANWGTHYGTHITGVSSQSFGRGQLTLFVDTPPARAATATSTLVEATDEVLRSRTNVLVDLTDEDCYAVTLERVLGGTEHTFSFHGPDGQATPIDVALTPEAGGTVLSPTASYGDSSSTANKDGELASLAFMYNVQRGEPSGIWALDYALKDQDDVHLRATMVNPPGCRLAVAQGKPPQGNKAYELTWAILRRSGDAPLPSQFLTVLEPHEGERLAKQLEPVSFTSPSKNTFSPIGVRITSEQGVDTILLQSVGETPFTTQRGIESDAEYAFIRERDGQIDVALFAGGTYLRQGDTELKQAASAYRGKIIACDWRERAIHVQPAPENAEALVGSHIQIANESGSHASYRIEAAEATDEGCRFVLPYDPRIGEGFVADCSAGCVRSATSLRFQGYWNYYAGKTIANENATATYRLTNLVRGGRCLIEPVDGQEADEQRLAADFVDFDGDDKPRFAIYDYGPADDVIVKRPLVVTP